MILKNLKNKLNTLKFPFSCLLLEVKTMSSSLPIPILSLWVVRGGLDVAERESANLLILVKGITFLLIYKSCSNKMRIDSVIDFFS
jgi:hypothetical protein